MKPNELAKPHDLEPICLLSFGVTRILLAGGPETRPSFWKAYRSELELNKNTNYNNYHIHLCRDQLQPLAPFLQFPFYYRQKQLVSERAVGDAAHSVPALLDI